MTFLVVGFLWTICLLFCHKIMLPDERPTIGAWVVSFLCSLCVAMDSSLKRWAAIVCFFCFMGLVFLIDRGYKKIFLGVALSQLEKRFSCVAVCSGISKYGTHIELHGVDQEDKPAARSYSLDLRKGGFRGDITIIPYTREESLEYFPGILGN